MKYFKTFELFDSEELRAQHDLDFIKGEIDKTEISKEDGPQLTDSVALNNAIIEEVPFFAYGNPKVLSDYIAYEFKHGDITFIIGISTEVMGTGRFPVVVKLMQNDEERKVTSNVFDFPNLIVQLLKFQSELQGHIEEINPLNN